MEASIEVPEFALVDVIQKGFVALTLLSALSAVTIYWFNRPRFLVPARYRNDRGRGPIGPYGVDDRPNRTYR